MFNIFILNIRNYHEKTIIDYAKFVAKELNYKGYIILDKKKPDGTHKKLVDSSIAKKYGIIANDIIILANQKAVKESEDLRKIIQESRNGSKKITLLIKRMQQNMILNLSLEE